VITEPAPPPVAPAGSTTDNPFGDPAPAKPKPATETTQRSAPEPEKPAEPSTGRAVGNALRRAFGIPGGSK
jgi:hypothetical protein